MNSMSFIGKDGVFTAKSVDDDNNLYFPIGNESGIKACVTPNLNGDSKIDQNTFILEPTSIENLHNNKSGRNFWCITEDGYFSAVGNSAESELNKYSNNRVETNLEAGFMWQSITRDEKKYGIKSQVTSFVPYDANVEVMFVELTNTTDAVKEVTPVAAVPLYGRSADNLRDHRHVTSLLHRIKTVENGVLVRPTLSFDERGHQKNEFTYFVCGVTGDGQNPVSFYPTVDEFVGEHGSYMNPKAVALNLEGVKAGTEFEGYEAVGAMRFEKVAIKPGETVSYTVLIGATKEEKQIHCNVAAFNSEEKVSAALETTKLYWNEKVNLAFETGDENLDGFMKWVCFQPFLRRIYGCSFLPHHDYGKGGRGWRDLWQDCLALLMMDPTDVGGMILDNFAGVRIDGTNATIIGANQGEFIADRNGITRVWMDHGMWPFLTTELYINQTGDIDILNKTVPYFKDKQVCRGKKMDNAWDTAAGCKQLTNDGTVYEGTVLEHLLLQHICAVHETGAHGNILLRDADWNDAIDMANEKGESVAFTCAYAGNLKALAEFVKVESDGKETVDVLEEIISLLEADSDEAFAKYLEAVSNSVSGNRKPVNRKWLAEMLEKKSADIMDHIRANEWINDGQGNSWFNSYYDNHGERVEGVKDGNTRMMLTGQVFSVMSGTATDEQVKEIAKSADKYLYDEAIGGYRLNTNFHEEKYDMGRMFGFAYGEKENGAVFSHMAVMYAAAMYKRGCSEEGFRALNALANAALNTEKSRIFPGVPEYFNNDGRGLYHYLTGAASWYALTYVTQVFGVRGELGDLLIEPKLLADQFDAEGKAKISLIFAEKNLEIVYCNNVKKTFKEYKIKDLKLDGNNVTDCGQSFVRIPRSVIEKLDNNVHTISVELN